MALVPRDILGDDFFAPFPVFRSGPLAPSSSSDALTRGIAIDVTEDNDKFEIKADLPGAKKVRFELGHSRFETALLMSRPLS